MGLTVESNDVYLILMKNSNVCYVLRTHETTFKHLHQISICRVRPVVTINQ